MPIPKVTEKVVYIIEGTFNPTFETRERAEAEALEMFIREEMDYCSENFSITAFKQKLRKDVTFARALYELIESIVDGEGEGE